MGKIMLNDREYNGGSSNNVDITTTLTEDTVSDTSVPSSKVVYDAITEMRNTLLGSSVYLTANTEYSFTPDIEAKSLVFFFCRVNSIIQTGVTLLGTSGRVYVNPTSYFDFTYNVTTHAWTFTSNVDMQIISIYTSN